MAVEMKNSGVQWIGEIPRNWLLASVGHLFKIKAGGDAKPNLYEYDFDEGHPYPVYTNTLDKNQVYAYSSKAFFHGPCITVTGRGAVGHAIYREDSFDAIIRLLVISCCVSGVGFIISYDSPNSLHVFLSNLSK